MPKERKNRILFVVSELVIISITLFVLFFSRAYTYDRNLDKHDDEILDYDVSNKKSIDTEDLIFDWTNADLTNKTVTFTGIKKNESKYSQMQAGEFLYDTLEIPSTVKYGGSNNAYENEYFTVTKIKQVIPSNSDLMSTPGCNVYDIIRGVIIPSTVTSIEEAAFLWYPRIEYFETPFVGTERGVEGAETANAFGSVFSYKTTYYQQTNNIHEADVTKYQTNMTDYSDPLTKPIVYNKTINSVTYSNKNSISRWFPGTNTLGVKAYLFPEKLKTVVISDDIQIPERAFLELKTVTSIVFGDSLTNLNAKSAVCHCQALTSITFPKTASQIGVEFLSDCDHLQSVTLPDGITEIPVGMFSRCTALKTVEIPATVEIVNSGAFQQCQLLENIKVFSTNPTTHEITSYTNESGFALPQNIRRIETEAFAQCARFKTISVATGKLEYIGEGAFKGCSMLQTLTVPFIGMEKGNSGCKEAMFGYIFGSGSVDQQYDSDGNIYQSAIPSTLTTVVITSETIVARGSMSQLPGVETVVITPVQNQIIEEAAFEKNTTLLDLSVPYVGNDQNGSRFGYIFGVDFYTGGYLAAGQGHYIPSSLRKIRITNMPVIRTNAFADLTSVTDISISNVATDCEQAIFYNNINLTNLELPFAGHHRGEKYEYYWYYHSYQRYNSLGWLFSRKTSSNEYGVTILQAFGDNYTRYVSNKLESITINDETAIGPHVFQGFKSVKSIIVNDDATYEHVGYISEGTMWGCENLQSISVPFIGQNYNTGANSGRAYTVGWFFGTSDYSGAYSAYQYSNYKIPKNLKSVYVISTNTASIKNIPNYALANMKSLESFGTSAAINQLGSHAFENDINLDSMTTNNATYQTVGDYAFANCRKVNCLYNNDENYFIPKTVINVGAHAFENTAIRDVDFSSTAEYKFESIGDYAFSGCSNITSINIPGVGGTYTLNSLGKGAFANCDSLGSVTLGPNAVSDYLLQNCISVTSVNLMNVTNKVPNGFFYGCTSLVNPILDDVTTEIGREAFYGCESLTSFEIKSTTTKIGSKAFTNCKGLEFMFMPRNVTVIEAEGFYGCDREKFFFYVLDPESDWSTGWVNNWNCEYPVYIYGAADNSIFTYNYVGELRGYEITGIVEPVGQETLYHDYFIGTLQLPSTYNGVKIVSLGENLLRTQPRVTAVIIPSTVRRICGTTELSGQNSTGALYNGNILTVYYDISVAQAENPGKYFANDLETTASGADIPALHGNENNWLAYGFVYYNNYWGYTASSGAPGATQVPYLKLSEFEYELDLSSEFIFYDGNLHTTDVVAVKTKAVVVDQGSIYEDYDSGNPTSGLTPYLPVELFNFSYSNNINAGSNALITVTINSTELTKFNNTVMANTDKTSIFYNDNITQVLVKNHEGTTEKLYLGGTGTRKFTIQKKEIVLFPHGESYSIYYKEKWNWSTWTDDYVDGLAGTGFKLTGTLTTKGDDAGLYLSLSNNLTVEDRTKLGNFEWRRDPRITLNGTNVTDNFTIVLGNGNFVTDERLKVEIKPLNVTIEWTGGSWANEWADNMNYYYSYKNDLFLNNFYLWAYTGEAIQPTAVARRALIDINNVPSVGDIENDIVATENITSGYGYSVVQQVIPNYPDYVSTMTDCTSSATAYLTSTKNYNLVYFDADQSKWVDVPTNSNTERKEYVVRYAVKKRDLTIRIVDNDYLIGYDEDYWLLDTWPSDHVTIEGLNSGSNFAGSLRTYFEDDRIWDPVNEKWIDSGNYVLKNYTNYGTYKLTQTGTQKDKLYDHYYLDWIPQTFDYDINYTSPMDFMIYRQTGVDGDNNPVYICENSYYNFNLDASITVRYNEFEPIYYIDGEEVESSGDTIIGGEDGDIYKIIEYNTEGYFHKFTVGAGNSGLTLNDENIVYYFGNTKEPTATYYEFRYLQEDPGYIVGVTLTRKNFIEQHINFVIKVYKSDYEFEEITREYDGNPIAPVAKKHPLGNDKTYKDKNFNDVLYDTTGQASLDSIEYTYYKCRYKNQASALNKCENVPFEIGYYVVHITADGSDFFNEYDDWFEFEITKRHIVIDINNFKVYDGYAYSQSYTMYNTDTTKILDGHKFIGVISTKSKDPGIYYGTGTHEDEEGNTINDVYTTYWYWKTPWKVFNTSDNSEVSSYYDVEVTGQFEIKKRTMVEYNEYLPDEESVLSYGAPDTNYSDWDGKYDGLPHTITVLTYNIWSTPTIYYTTSEILSADQDGESVSWSTTKPQYYTPGTYDVYFKVVADYYDTFYGHEIVKIEEQEIEYTVGESVYEYDGQYHSFIVSVSYPLSATVEYSLDKTSWTTNPYEYRDYMDNDTPNYKRIYYRISEANFKKVGFDVDCYVDFTISQDGFLQFNDGDYSITGYDDYYDGIPHGIKVTKNNALIYGTKIYYSLVLSDDLSDWSLTPITLTDFTPNPVKVYVRFVDAKRENDNKRYVDTYGDIYFATINIKQLTFDSSAITIQNYEGTYDGKEHTIEVLGLEAYVGKGVTVQYSTDSNSQASGSGWQSAPIKYKNASIQSYPIYVKISADNYETLYLNGHVLINTCQLAGVIADGHTDTNPYKIQYTSEPVLDSAIPVNTLNSDDSITEGMIHDGKKTYTFYSAAKAGYWDGEGDDKQWIEEDWYEEDEIISRPTKLGIYYVKITYATTSNCTGVGAQVMIVEGFFEITAREVKITYNKSQQYTGKALSPNFTVSTGTKDVVTLNVKLVNPAGLTPDEVVAIGDYYYTISLNGDTSLYVLPEEFKGEILFQITKRKVIIHVEDNHIYNYNSTTNIGVPWHKTSGWDQFINGTFLPGHTLKLDMQTISYARNTYVYPYEEGSQNAVLLNELDVVALDNNNEISVMDYYDIDLTAIVKIVFRTKSYNFQDKEVFYTGELFGLSLSVADDEIINPIITFTEDDLSELEDKSLANWSLYSPTYSEVGEYDVNVRIISDNLEVIYTTAKLIIKQTKLQISAVTFNGVYDGLEHNVTAKVTNLVDKIADVLSPDSIRYYPVKNFTKAQITTAYKKEKYSLVDYNIFSQGLTSCINAGTYYAAIAYRETEDWVYSYEIIEVTIKPKDVQVQLPTNNITNSKDYDGKVMYQYLKNAVINAADLIPGHSAKTGADLKKYRIKTNSADVKWEDGLPVAYGNNDFEFADYGLITDDENAGADVTANYHPVIVTGISFVIKPISFTFEVANFTKKSYATVQNDSGDWEAVLVSPDMILPNMVNPTYYFDNQPHFKYYAVDDYDNPTVELGIDNQFNVGRYYVIVTFEAGTNFKAYDDENMHGIVEITPMVVEVEWDSLTVDFNGAPQKPTAVYEDGFENIHGLNVSIIVYEDGNPTSKPMITPAGTYSVIASFMDNDNIYGNYQLDTYSLSRLFVINTLVFIYEVDEVTYNTEVLWSKDIHESDFPNFPSDLSLVGSNSDTATLKTPAYTENTYYGGDLVWDYKVLKGTEDLTDSIELIAVGKVIIYSEEIKYEVKDVEVPYDKQWHTVLEGLTVTNPSDPNMYEVLVKKGTETKYSSKPDDAGYKFIDVGTHIIDFKIVSKIPGSTQEETGHITITIKQIEADATIYGSLDQEYDGIPVSATKISVTGSYNKHPDGVLIYTYYRTDSSYSNPILVSTTDSTNTEYYSNSGPRDVGYYMVKITNTADDIDDDDDYVKNYTKLELTKTFEISNRSITYAYDGEQVVLSGSLGGAYQNIVPAIAQSDTWIHNPGAVVEKVNLANNDELHVIIQTNNNVSGSVPLTIGVYEILTGLDYTYSGEINNPKAQNFYTNDYFSIKWYVLSRTRKEEDGVTPLNVSTNYSFNLNFKLDIHYPDIDHTITAPTDAAYDKDIYHSATITYGNTVVTTVTEKYSHILIDGGNVKNNISNMQFKDPGVYRVSYTLEADGYRKYVGTYDISIQYSGRTLLSTFESGLNNYRKYYDGENVTLATILGTSGGKLKFNEVFETGIYPDVFSDDDVTIEFRKQTSSSTTTEIKNVGIYSFIITVPKSAYYSETVINGTYEIEPGEILVFDREGEPPYVAPYTGTYAYYTLSDNDPYFDMTLNGNPLPSGMTFSGLIQTTGSGIGTYLASASQIVPVNNYIISGGNTNYHVTLSITMTIQAGMMVATTNNITVPYAKDNETGNAIVRIPTVTNVTPKKEDTTLMYAYYVDADTELSWTTTPLGRGEVGTSIIKIKVMSDNYDDLILTSTVTITKATTTMTVPNLTRKYNAQFVSLPANIETNTDVNRDQWNITYEEKIGTSWQNMNTIPINVGEYRINVEIFEDSSNIYTGGNWQKEFKILQKDVEVNWTDTDFTYDGTIHIPTATLNTGLKDDNNIPITPTFEVNVTDIDDNTVNEPIMAGVYKATVSINDNINWKFDEEQMIIFYAIKKRTVTLHLNTNGMTYDGSFPEFKYIGEYAQIGADEYYYNNDVTTAKSSLNPEAYYSSNIARYKVGTDDRGDFFDEYSIITTPFSDVGTYASLNGDINGLDWVSDYKIWNYENIDVTSCYIVKYEMSYLIDYDTIVYSANSYEVTYDGLPHKLVITVSNAENATIKYWDGSDYTINENQATEGINSFTDVNRASASDTVQPYVVKFKIWVPNHNPIEGSRTITINPKNANLYLKNNKILDKDYDGDNIDLKSSYPKNLPLAQTDFGYTDMETYRRDITVKFERKQADNTYITVNDTSDVGEYRVTAVLDEGNDKNYNGGTWTKDVIISKREITITKLDNSGNLVQLDKTYDGLSKTLTRDGTKTEFDVLNLVYGQKFTGTVKSKYAYVKIYENQDDFDWVNGYKVTKEVITGGDSIIVDVTDNYIIKFALKFNITNATMTVVIQNLEPVEWNDSIIQAVYGVVGGGKKYSLDIVVTGPLVYNITYQANDDETVLFTNPQFSTQGLHTVTFKITADNFEDYIGEGRIYIEGLDANGGYVDYVPQTTYNNTPYMSATANGKPKYISENQGLQEVTYYDYDKKQLIPNEAPTNAGTYYFSIYVHEWGDYKSVNTTKYMFIIDKVTREVVFENYEVTYNGQEQVPTAYIVAYDNVNQLPLVVESARTQTNVNGYDVVAKFADDDPNKPNYELTGTNKANLFKIYPIEVEKPSISTTMKFTYSETYTLYDADGYPICKKDDDGKDIYNLVTWAYSDNYPKYYTYDDVEEKYVEAVGITEFEDGVDYYVPEFEVFRFGDEVVVKNTDGNIYLINEDGIITGVLDKNDMVTEYDAPEQAGLYKVILSPNRDSDEVAEISNIKHVVTVSLIDDVNYVWKDTTVEEYLDSNYNDEYEIPFVIKRFDIDNNPEGLKVEVKSEFKYYIMDINSGKITPNAVVNLVTSDGLFIREITSGRISGKEAYLIDSYNEVKTSADYDIPGEIRAQGMKNIQFDVVGTYEKRATPPVLFEMKANTIRRYVSISVNEVTNVVTKETNDDYGVEKTQAEETNIYLGRIYVNTKIQTILDDFKNEQNLMAVFDKDGNLVDPSQYGTKNFGSGFKIVLYSDTSHSTVIDSITGIIYGDFNGDGLVNGVDLVNIRKFVGGSIKYSDDPIGYIASTIGSNPAPNGVGLVNVKTFIGGGADFNADYQVTPEEAKA